VDRTNLLQAFLGQVASALERCELARQAEQVRLQVETEKLRNSLLSAVSHDLRTPLSTITGSASLLADAATNLGETERTDLADSILQESERLNQLVANLLDLTRLEAGALTVELALQPIEEVIGVVLARHQRHLRDHPVKTTIADDLPPVPLDGILIQQALVNLLDNAAKFSPTGAGIELRVGRGNGGLLVEVLDARIGIVPGEERRIFDKFYQTHRSGRSGSGIGLAICKGVIDLHGGALGAENRPAGGARFWFTLPLAEATDAPATSPSTPTHTPVAIAHEPR